MTAREFVKMANLGRSQRIYLYAVGGFTRDTGARVADVTDGADGAEADGWMDREVAGFDFNERHINIYVKIS